MMRFAIQLKGDSAWTSTDIEPFGMSTQAAKVIQQAFDATLKANGLDPHAATLLVQTYENKASPLAERLDLVESRPSFLADLFPGFMRLTVSLGEGGEYGEFAMDNGLAGCVIGDLYILHRLLSVLIELLHDEIADTSPLLTLHIGDHQYHLTDLYAKVPNPQRLFDKSLATFPTVMAQAIR